MKVFLSYSSNDREVAEEIQLALVGSGCEVFFDRETLPPGGDYHARIEAAVRDSDALVFLISPHSVAEGSYALTELKLARAKWPHPKQRVVPVRLHRTPWAAMPPYLRSVTVLEPEGNVAAEVLEAVSMLGSTSKSTIPTVNRAHIQPGLETDGSATGSSSNYKVQVFIALLGLVGVLGAALLANWNSVFPISPRPETISTPTALPKYAGSGGEGMKGPDSSASGSPDLNKECPEITFIDYSKFPPESRIIRRCDP